MTRKQRKTRVQKRRFILEHSAIDDILYLHDHTKEGRTPVLWLCPERITNLFPQVVKLKIGESIEIDISIRAIGEALPWKDWTWEEVD